MKNGLMIGVALGVMAATAIYTREKVNCGIVKRGKKAIVKKIENMF